MPRGLQRYYGSGYLHFITTSCYRHRPLLGSPHRRDLFVKMLEQARRRYGFVVVGYVVMPEHVHLLISEPDRGTPSTIMQVIKQRVAHKLLPHPRRTSPHQGDLWQAGESVHLWQKRFYDFVVKTEKKRIQKLVYMHRNPVRRGLVTVPELWRWSSYRHYAFGEKGGVVVNDLPRAVMKIRSLSNENP